MADVKMLAEKVDKNGLRAFLGRIAAVHAKSEITFVCIGTDCSTGDSLGPLVGTLLRERGFTRVFGTLEHPCDANKLPAMMASLDSKRKVIALDACLGRPENIGSYLVADGPLTPARSIGKSMAPVGDYSIAGIVNAMSLKPYWTLQSTSLFRVMGMATEIADAISKEWLDK
jgi:putative sporulation protein YyaC